MIHTPASLRLLFIILSTLLITSCGQIDSNKNDSKLTDQQKAIQLIANYAQNNKVAPSLQNYLDAKIIGVTLENLAEINLAIKALTYEDVDTHVEIQNVFNNLVLIDTTKPTINLLGSNPQTIIIGKNYSELGAIANDDIDGNISENIVINTTDLDTLQLGSYSVIYYVQDSAGNEESISRTINVVKEKDIVQIGLQEKAIQLIANYAQNNKVAPSLQNYLDAKIIGVTLENLAEINLAVKALTYEDVDTHVEIQNVFNNLVLIDTTKPTINLLGSNPQTIIIGKNYSELGAIANDDIDGNISENIVINTTDLDTLQLGSYSVIYYIQDSAGNEESISRIINIVEEKHIVQIELQGTIFSFNDYSTTEHKNDYIGSYAVAFSDSKTYTISASAAIGSSSTGTQPKQYFGFQPLDENKVHISGTGGTYQYTVNTLLNSGNHSTKTVIGDTITPRAGMAYFKPAILANYGTSQQDVSVLWDNITIEALDLEKISGDLLLLKPLLKVNTVNNQAITASGVIIEGTYGELNIKNNGEYYYSINPLKISLKNESLIGTESYTVVLSDTSYLILEINITNKGSSPIITLYGNDELTLPVGFQYHDGGVLSVYDHEDQQISIDEVIIDDSQVNTEVAGNYNVTYSVSDSDGNTATAIRQVFIEIENKEYSKTVQSEEKAIGAADLIYIVSAASLRKHRKNLNIQENKKINNVANYAYKIIDNAVYWNGSLSSNDGSFIWQPGVRKNHSDYKYAGKINGSYQTIPTDGSELEVAIVDGIGTDSSHYLLKWPVFYNALRDASSNTAEYNYYDQIVKADAIQTALISDYIDLDGDGDEYLLKNYMDGTNGPFRWAYAGRGNNYGFNSYGFPYIFGESAIAYSGSTFFQTVHQNILDNIDRYPRIHSNSPSELLLKISIKYNESNPTLSASEIQLFNTEIKPNLEKTFTIPASQNGSSGDSYNKITGPDNLLMHFAFKHNINEWKEAYYQHFKRFSDEIIDTDAVHFKNLDSDSDLKWDNLNGYYESHFLTWASSFLQLSSHYDSNIYPSTTDYNQQTEINIRNFIESYVLDRYKERRNGIDEAIKYH